MSKNSSVALPEGADLGAVVELAKQQLQSQGFEATGVVSGNNCATLTVQKDRDGIKNIIGLGVECRATLTVMNGNTMTINVESEWGNKILALALGWFLCLVPFITGIVGCSNQSGLPNKVIQAVQSAAVSAQN